jgi:voltage-gated potassium channel
LRRPVVNLILRSARRATLTGAVTAIVAFATTFTLAAALAERLIEPKTFKTFPEACWWAVQTVSTVGYGDLTPVTTAGRFVASVVMLFGVALVPAVTSIVVAILVEQHRGGAEDEGFTAPPSSSAPARSPSPSRSP